MTHDPMSILQNNHLKEACLQSVEDISILLCMAMLLLALCMAQSMQLLRRTDGVECALSSFKIPKQLFIAVPHA